MPAAPREPHHRLHIGDVATEVELSLRTIRYYEEVGLVTPARTEGGHRLYSRDDVARLNVIKSAKALGLTLEEMGQLVDVVEQSRRADELPDEGLAAVLDGLREFAERSDAAITRHDRELAQARELRLRIGEQLGRCEALLLLRDDGGRERRSP